MSCATVSPKILRRGSLSATAALAGSTTYVLLASWLNITKLPAMVAAAAVAMILRVGSLWLGWESPEPFDLSPAVASVPRSIFRGTAALLRRTTRTHDTEADHESDSTEDQS